MRAARCVAGPWSDRCVGRSACSRNGPSDPTGRLRTTPGRTSSLRPPPDLCFRWPRPDGRDCCQRPKPPRRPSSKAPQSRDRRSRSTFGRFLAFAPHSSPQRLDSNRFSRPRVASTCWEAVTGAGQRTVLPSPGCPIAPQASCCPRFSPVWSLVVEQVHAAGQMFAASLAQIRRRQGQASSEPSESRYGRSLSYLP